VKCSKGKRVQTFFTLPEYAEWRELHKDGRGWKVRSLCRFLSLAEKS